MHKGTGQKGTSRSWTHSPPTGQALKEICVHQRTLCFPLARGAGAWLSWDRWAVSGEAAEGWPQELGSLGNALHPVAGPTDAPAAQRSASRSSPSSAWIRSFRLFLLAALFNTALNRGWERGGVSGAARPAVSPS